MPATSSIDPGEVGGQAKDFNFEIAADSDELQFDIFWTDNKTLQRDTGSHVFRVLGPKGRVYTDILLDAFGNEIPGTELAGATPSEQDPIRPGVIELPEMTVFGGIRILASFGSGTVWQWNWNDGDRPIVVPGRKE